MTNRDFTTPNHNQMIIRMIIEESFGEDVASLEVNSSGQGYMITHNEHERDCYSVAYFKAYQRVDERQFFPTYDKSFAFVQSHKDHLEQLALNDLKGIDNPKENHDFPLLNPKHWEVERDRIMSEVFPGEFNPWL